MIVVVKDKVLTHQRCVKLAMERSSRRNQKLSKLKSIRVPLMEINMLSTEKETKFPMLNLVMLWLSLKRKSTNFSQEKVQIY